MKAIVALCCCITAVSAEASRIDKTLVSWVSLDNLDQRGGSVLTIQQGGKFDGIVFGEIQPAKWMAGSNGLVRTETAQESSAPESAAGDALVQMAIVYQGNRISIYRNGERYTSYDADNIDLLSPADNIAVFGLRHVGATILDGRISGAIEDARIYGQALTAEEIKTLEPNFQSVIRPYAWWDFEDGNVSDRTGRFPYSLLEGGAKVENGKLVLGKESVMIAMRTENAVEKSQVAKELFEIETPTMPDPIPDTWLTYHLAHPGPDGAIPADPNCAIYYKGRYHLHYIYNSHGCSFAHVTSTDMVHWKWEPTVLTPPLTGHGMYSGTAFLTKEGVPAIIYHGQGSGKNQLAFAKNDDLSEWTETITIEPKTVEGEPAEMKQWDPDCWLIGDTYYGIGGGGNPTLATSTDLKEWTFQGELFHPDFPADLGVDKGEDVSCPNMFKIGDKWMLLCISHGLGARYYLGDFKDGKYLPDHHALMNWAAWDFFAPESLLTPDGRRVMWAWCTPWVNDMQRVKRKKNFDRLMNEKLQPGIQSLPRELSLDDEGSLVIKPLRELSQLRSHQQEMEGFTITSGETRVLQGIAGDTIELEVVFDKPQATEFGLRILTDKEGTNGFSIAYGADRDTITVDYVEPPFSLKQDEDLTLRIFIDKGMIEVFANDRQAAVAWHDYEREDQHVALYANGGDIKVKKVTGWKMKSMYTKRVADKAAQSMFYKAQRQETGNMWDVWLYHNEGTYFLYYLANSDSHWDNISMATSPDGVHWTEMGPILTKVPEATWMGTGSTWKSPDFDKDGKFYMNFSEEVGPRQSIQFAESEDLLHWTRLTGDRYRFVQDERWYQPNGRWDCIWTNPRPGGGLYGYWTATPKRGVGFGLGVSEDGITWEVLPPPELNWGDHKVQEEVEVGSVEKIGDKYFALLTAMTRSQNEHHVVTFTADSPEGPFTAAKKNYHLLPGLPHTWFPRFFPHPDGMLVCHFTRSRDNQVSFAPLKEALLDEEGTLRLAWWEGNEGMKHEPVKVLNTADLTTAVAMLGNTFDVKQGTILEGALRLPRDKDAPRCGLYIECMGDQGVAILMDSAGLVELGKMQEDGTEFKAEHRIDREIKYEDPVRFRLLVRSSLMEFYLDNILIDSFGLPATATGRVGLIHATEDAANTLQAWR